MNEEYLREWIKKAEEDYHAAVALNRKKNPPVPNVVGFHCQQCVEKYLKAILVFHDLEVPKVHDLLVIHRLCISVEPDLEMIGDLLDELNPFAVEYRYPGDEITPEEASSAVVMMKKIRITIRTKLPVH